MSMREEATVRINHDVSRLTNAAGLRFSTTATETDLSRLDGGASTRLKPRIDEARIKVGPATTAAEIRHRLEGALVGTPSSTHAFAQYQVHQFASERSLLQATEAALSAGVHHHRVYEYSVLGDHQLDWLAAMGRLVVP